MRKYIVLSVNANPDYWYYVPLTCWAWRKFGWEPILFIQGNPRMISDDGMKIIGMIPGHQLVLHEGYRSDTITQVSRLYAACVQDGYLMTGDIDMVPLSDYWKPNENAVTVYGHDLTGFTHAPICYLGMPSTKWREVMQLDSNDYNALIKRDLGKHPNAKNTDFYKYWFVDQDHITGMLNIYGKDKITFINRGQYSNGYARGRVDRGAWTLNHSEFIDCHMFQQLYFKQNQDKFDKTMELLTSIWPDEDFGWFLKYTEGFRKLTNQI